jgi:O-antigen/teichoic acid export membrane protein
LLGLMLGGAALITILFYLLQRPILAWKSQLAQDYRFAVLFVGASLLFYPLVTLPTARLERRLDYGHIAWIESASTLLERGAPAFILIWLHAGVYSFLWALLLSRTFRVVTLSFFHRPAIRSWCFSQVSHSFHLVREGSWIQLGSLANVIRDNLPVLLVGPFFGKAWIGNYTWAMQVCQISSQAFAQLSARVSLPVFARELNFQTRWPKCLQQIRLLTILTGPVLCGIWIVLPVLNMCLFHGKWAGALILIPPLFLRMLPGLATTPIGPLLIVHRGGGVYARVVGMWTLIEIAGALLFITLLGPQGLAWSYGCMVWFGLWLMLAAMGQNRHELAKQLARQIFRRPGLVFAVTAAIAFTLLLKTAKLGSPQNLVVVGSVASAVIVGSYLLEPDVRRIMLHEKATTS